MILFSESFRWRVLVAVAGREVLVLMTTRTRLLSLNSVPQEMVLGRAVRLTWAGLPLGMRSVSRGVSTVLTWLTQFQGPLPLLVTGLGLWVTWKMFSWAFKRSVLRVLNTEGRLVVVDQYILRGRQTEEWPIAEASHIVAKGKEKPELMFI